MGRKAFAFFSFLLLSAASFYCLFFICEFFLTPKIPNTTDYTYETDCNSSENFSIEKNEISSVENSVSSVDSKKDNSSLGSEIAAATKSKAKGKISTRFIDSSSANLSYQKV